MKLSNLRLGPVEPGEPVPPLAQSAPELQRAHDVRSATRPFAPQVAAPLDLDDPLAMGIEPRRGAGRVMAVAIGAVVVIAAAGIVAVMSLVDDRAMVPSGTTLRGSSFPAEQPGDTGAERWMAGTDRLHGTTAPAPIDRTPGEPSTRIPTDTTPPFPASAGSAATAPFATGAPAPADRAQEGTLDAAILIARGDEYFARSDVAAARLFYQRAFNGVGAAGANAMGATYDPLIIEQRGLRGIRPDAATALQWYRIAAQRGSSDADVRGSALIDRLRTRAAAGDTEARAILERALY